MQNEFDVVIIGAGLSGIGAGFRLQRYCKTKSFIILEARSAMGGTWDLFRYPGIRSDSDMYTMGFSFNPWRGSKALADGPSILRYINDTAEKFGIDKKIRFNHKVTDASWNTDQKVWTLTISSPSETKKTQIRCRFLLNCSGYYNYDKGHQPSFAGSDSFKGRIIHPQHWDETIDYTQKKIVVIGSGATAVTLVPVLALKAKKVTMLQRSPSYILSLQGEDSWAKILEKTLPSGIAYRVMRWKNILMNMGFYTVSRKYPGAVKRFIQNRIKKDLGKTFEIKHFDPSYNPWDQRLCVVPDADLFRALKNGKAEVVTDTIKHITPKGILLQSGVELEADLIVSATGLVIQVAGGMTIHVDGKLIETAKTHCYRGVMFSDVPNFAVTLGYTNSSWTLKCDLSCRFVTKLLNYMDRKKLTICTPRYDSGSFGSENFTDLTSGFILRAADILPKQGSRHPWKVYQNYVKDLVSLRLERINHKHLEYK